MPALFQMQWHQGVIINNKTGLIFKEDYKDLAKISYLINNPKRKEFSIEVNCLLKSLHYKHCNK